MNANRILTYLLLSAMISVSVVLLIDTRAQDMRREALEQSLAMQMTEIIGLNSGAPDEQQTGAYETDGHHVIWTVERVEANDESWSLKWTLRYKPKQDDSPQ